MDTDDRFSKIGNDPRFKRMPKTERKVKIDKRFKEMFTDKKFKLKYSVDKRGRPIKSTTNENFKKYYDISESDEDESDDKEQSDENVSTSQKTGVKNLNSAAENNSEKSDDEDIGEEQEDSDNESDESGLGSGPDLARGEGNIETSSEEEDSEDEENEDDDLVENWADLDKNAVEAPEITSRLAVCNMDWDRVKAQDIFVLLQSFKPTGGAIKSVSIYPSEFGLQRMKIEDVKGPMELTEKSISDSADHDAVDAEGSSYHTEKLRKYQLNRLRYYYAVVICDSAETANKIYEECDNMEYESSSNKLDLRFIPEDMTFDHSPKSVCTELPSTYSPSLFFTTALCQSKVDLTWDETDHDRLKVTMNPSIGKRKKGKDEIKEEDFKAYLASSSDEEEAGPLGDLDLGDESSESEDEEEKINKYRSLIQGIKESEEKKKNKDIEMEISWEPGLKESTEKMIKKKEKEKNLTVWEKYLEKKKEKKQKKRENSMPEKSESIEAEKSESDEAAFSDDDIPDDIKSDPFFQDSDQEQTLNKKKKKEKKKVKGKETQEDKELKEKTKAELSLLMMDEDDDDDKRHFSLKNLVEEESLKKKKKKKRIKKGKQENKETEDHFKIDVTDPRFEALYTSHMYNIDPSVPEYKKTKGMQDIVNAKQEFKKRPHDLKRKSKQTDANQVKSKTMKCDDNSTMKDTSLQRLVESVKMKTKQFKNKK